MSMRIIRIINNNVVSCKDEENKEIVVMGSGIGFQRKLGDKIEEQKIEKKFLLFTDGQMEQWKVLAERIPYSYIKTTNEIISYARASLHKKLNDSIYITLADHLNFAIERQKEGLIFQNKLLWEIKRFYNHEFMIGIEALSIVKYNLGVQLSEDEAGFIALHIITAEMDTDIEWSMTMTTIIQGILNIIKFYYGIILDEDTINYERFVTHLKFFIQRAIGKKFYETGDSEFYEMVKSQYQDEYACAEKISSYISDKMDYQVTQEELIYLTIHIRRVIPINS